MVSVRIAGLIVRPPKFVSSGMLGSPPAETAATLRMSALRERVKPLARVLARPVPVLRLRVSSVRAQSVLCFEGSSAVLRLRDSSTVLFFRRISARERAGDTARRTTFTPSLFGPGPRQRRSRLARLVNVDASLPGVGACGRGGGGEREVRSGVGVGCRESTSRKYPTSCEDPISCVHESASSVRLGGAEPGRLTMGIVRLA